MKHHDTPRYSHHVYLFQSNQNISQPKYWGVSTACFLYPQDFGVGSLKDLQHPRWWVHGNSTIQLKQIIRYGLLWTSRSKQSLCDLCATTTSALKVGVMTVHNIISCLGLSAEIKSLPPFPAPSRPPWHFSIFMMKSPSFLNRSEAWAKPLRQSQLDGEWLPCVENCEKCFHLEPFWLHNLQKPSESYLACPTLSNWRWRKKS